MNADTQEQLHWKLGEAVQRRDALLVRYRQAQHQWEPAEPHREWWQDARREVRRIRAALKRLVESD